MILFPFFKGVKGFGKGFPNLEPMPAARITIFIFFVVLKTKFKGNFIFYLLKVFFLIL
jgi:hypothetical protein